MKKLFLVIFLLLAFNLTPQGNITPYIRKRQSVEYTRGIKFRELDEADYIRDKIVMYAKLEMIRIKMERIEYTGLFAGTG